jgi:diguanylate cyclase (GGDEF)-like protein
MAEDVSRGLGAEDPGHALDLLTDLVNHRHFVNLLSKELRRALREGNPVSLVVADVDGFKEVNDHHGHVVGDQVLVSVAKCFKEAIRPYDIAARIGGDEFAIILPGVHKEQATAVADRLRRVVAEATREGPAPVTVSLGVASYPADAETHGLLVKRADEAMYEAKRRARDDAAPGSPRSASPTSVGPAAVPS